MRGEQKAREIEEGHPHAPEDEGDTGGEAEEM